MSLRSRSISALVLAIGLAGATYGQETKTTTPDQTGKQTVDQHHGKRAGKRGDLGRGAFGRRGDFAGRMGGRMGRMGGRIGRMGGGLAGIQLTDAQKQQIRQIREANRPDKALMDEMRTIMQARRSGALTDAQKARVKAIRDQQQAKAKSVHEQIQNVLTPEQKAEIQKHMELRKAHRELMRQRVEEFRKNHPRTRTAPTAPAKPITK